MQPRTVRTRGTAVPTVVYGERVVGIGFFGRLRAVVGYLLLVSVLGAIAAGLIVAAIIALVAGIQGLSL